MAIIPFYKDLLDLFESATGGLYWTTLGLGIDIDYFVL
jgi:hypothetical protein